MFRNLFVFFNLFLTVFAGAFASTAALLGSALLFSGADDAAGAGSGLGCCCAVVLDLDRILGD